MLKLNRRWACSPSGLRLALLTVLASSTLGFLCAPPIVHRVDLGHGLTLKYWTLEVQRISPTERVYVFEGKLFRHDGGWGHWRDWGDWDEWSGWGRGRRRAGGGAVGGRRRTSAHCRRSPELTAAPASGGCAAS